MTNAGEIRNEISVRLGGRPEQQAVNAWLASLPDAAIVQIAQAIDLGTSQIRDWALLHALGEIRSSWSKR